MAVVMKYQIKLFEVFLPLPHSKYKSAIELIPQCGTVSG